MFDKTSSVAARRMKSCTAVIGTKFGVCLKLWVGRMKNVSQIIYHRRHFVD